MFLFCRASGVTHVFKITGKIDPIFPPPPKKKRRMFSLHKGQAAVTTLGILVAKEWGIHGTHDGSMGRGRIFTYMNGWCLWETYVKMQSSHGWYGWWFFFKKSSLYAELRQNKKTKMGTTLGSFSLCFSRFLGVENHFFEIWSKNFREWRYLGSPSRPLIQWSAERKRLVNLVEIYSPEKLTACPCKMVVGKLFSLWETRFSGVFAVSFREGISSTIPMVVSFTSRVTFKTTKTSK